MPGQVGNLTYQHRTVARATLLLLPWQHRGWQLLHVIGIDRFHRSQPLCVLRVSGQVVLLAGVVLQIVQLLVRLLLVDVRHVLPPRGAYAFRPWDRPLLRSAGMEVMVVEPVFTPAVSLSFEQRPQAPAVGSLGDPDAR